MAESSEGAGGLKHLRSDTESVQTEKRSLSHTHDKYVLISVVFYDNPSKSFWFRAHLSDQKDESLKELRNSLSDGKLLQPIKTLDFRKESATALTGSTVYIIGGETDFNPVKEIYAPDPDSPDSDEDEDFPAYADRWEELKEARKASIEGSDFLHKKVEALDAMTGYPSIIPNMNRERKSCAAVSFGGKIYVFGGIHPGPLAPSDQLDIRYWGEVYDPDTFVWKFISAPPSDLLIDGPLLAVPLEDTRCILLFNYSFFSCRCRYYPATDSWVVEYSLDYMIDEYISGKKAQLKGRKAANESLALKMERIQSKEEREVLSSVASERELEMLGLEMERIQSEEERAKTEMRILELEREASLRDAYECSELELLEFKIKKIQLQEERKIKKIQSKDERKIKKIQSKEERKREASLRDAYEGKTLQSLELKMKKIQSGMLKPEREAPKWVWQRLLSLKIDRIELKRERIKSRMEKIQSEAEREGRMLELERALEELEWLFEALGRQTLMPESRTMITQGGKGTSIADYLMNESSYVTTNFPSFISYKDKYRKWKCLPQKRNCLVYNNIVYWYNSYFGDIYAYDPSNSQLLSAHILCNEEDIIPSTNPENFISGLPILVHLDGPLFSLVCLETDKLYFTKFTVLKDKDTQGQDILKATYLSFQFFRIDGDAALIEAIAM